MFVYIIAKGDRVLEILLYTSVYIVYEMFIEYSLKSKSFKCSWYHNWYIISDAAVYKNIYIEKIYFVTAS